MATSGTVARTSLDVAQVIEHAARRCGTKTSLLTSEQVVSAKENLFLLLVEFANRGLNLWCVQKYIQVALAYETQFNLPLGTQEVLEAVFRTGTNTTGTVSTYRCTVDYGVGSSVAAASGSVMIPTAGDYTLYFESSSDLLTWTQRGVTSVTTNVANEYASVDATSAPGARYWRVRLSDTTVTLTSGFVTSNVSELPMSKQNRQDYAYQPNKTFTGAVPVQFYFDKQVQPRVNVWPALSTNGLFVWWLQRQVQDIGDLNNTLDIPDNGLDAVIWALSKRMLLELPADQIIEGRYTILTSEAEKALRAFEDSQSDGAPIRIQPNIGYYTRG